MPIHYSSPSYVPQLGCSSYTLVYLQEAQKTDILIDDTKGKSKQLSVLPDFGSLRTRKDKLVFNRKNGSPTDPLSQVLENLPRADLSKAAQIDRTKLK